MSERLALVVANAQYSDEKLVNLESPIEDAEIISHALADPAIGDFKVRTLVDQSFPVIRREIVQFYAQKKRDDLLLFYFTGHGIRDAHGSMHLLTRDSETKFLQAASIEASFILQQIRESRSGKKIVILDSSHSGAFFYETNYIASGLAVLTSSSGIEFAFESNQDEAKKRSSLFTKVLFEGMQSGTADLNHDGIITIDELFEYAQNKVLIESGGKQTPQKWTLNLPGQIMIARHQTASTKNSVFISYARKDVEFAQKLNVDLKKHGVNTWIDEIGIRSGEAWPDQIAKAIENCKIVMVILSPDSVASKWVEREVSFADKKGKRLLPLIHRPCELPGWFELRFSNTQWSDFSQNGEAYESNLSNLLSSLRDVFGIEVK